MLTAQAVFELSPSILPEFGLNRPNTVAAMACHKSLYNQLESSIFAVYKDSYVVYACAFDRNGKWEWFCESKWRCKNDAAKMTLHKEASPSNVVGRRHYFYE